MDACEGAATSHSHGICTGTLLWIIITQIFVIFIFVFPFWPNYCNRVLSISIVRLFFSRMKKPKNGKILLQKEQPYCLQCTLCRIECIKKNGLLLSLSLEFKFVPGRNRSAKDIYFLDFVIIALWRFCSVLVDCVVLIVPLRLTACDCTVQANCSNF